LWEICELVLVCIKKFRNEEGLITRCLDNLFSNGHKKIKGIIDHRKIDNDNEKVKKSQISILHPPSG
jgi:hypothetical protein